MFAVKNIKNSKNLTPLVLSVRNGHRMRGKPPAIARSLTQRLAEEFPVDKDIEHQVNIGFPALKTSRSDKLKERLEHIKIQRSNPELEKKSRSGQLLIDLQKVEQDSQYITAPHNLRRIAEHYGIFRDLFKDAYFVPRVSLDIKYQVEDIQVPVYNGNIILPAETKTSPLVSFDGTVDPITSQKNKETSYWTLVATNPDSHLGKGEQEYLHWFVSNIPNGKVEDGETIASYIQPFPAKGLGYQRVVFTLYKQNSKIDFSSLKVAEGKTTNERLFSTRDFYKQFQSEITPAGLSFFQSVWDKTLTEFYHQVLNLKEPTFTYNHPAPYRADQQWFPLKKPFNLYMDKYRDEKQISKEYLEKRLAKTNPFDGPEAPLKYPNAHYFERNTPSWLQFELKKERLGVGRIAKNVE